jgi:peptide subunit release factor 1 (eRF1)
MKTQSKSRANPASDSDDQLWQIKRLQMRRALHGLEEVKGVGTSLISLMIPPSGSLQRVLTKLHDEHALSDQIQSRV